MAIKSKKTILRVHVTNMGKIRIPNTFFFWLEKDLKLLDLDVSLILKLVLKKASL
jgi:hypothetical protein